jgi:Fe(3+) dicitrate transport protein
MAYSSAKGLLLVTLTTLSSTTALAADAALIDTKANKQVEIISIIGQSQQLKKETGSAYVLTQEQLAQFEFDDIHRVLQSVPGVYIREEDGYGLRPNIGIRGATTERSSKITIMEDGVLIAPAPYAAPAAYYFPNSARMTGIEVLKGPSAISYGPNTVGGAINMKSRAISDQTQGHVELAYGMDNYQKLHSYYSYKKDNLGMLIEGIRLSSDGFKALDNGGDTGFVKNELLFKLNYELEDAATYQLWQFKAGYGDEQSNETYLGLTEDDFKKQPNRRYLASQNDLMTWEHTQLQLSHYIEFNDSLSIHTQAYRRDFDRDWGKLNRFNTNRSIQTILLSPSTGLNKLYFDVLTGERNSQIITDTLMIGHNDRQYYSQGIQSKLLWQSNHFGAESELELGIRFHQDQVKRNHFEDGFLMQQGQLVATNEDTKTTINNKDTVDAIATHLNYKLIFEQLTLTSGVRIENIEGKSQDILHNSVNTNSDTLVSPGFGAFYSFNDEFGLLAGANKGFVPNSPGQNDNIKAEESWNYEFGFRYSNEKTSAELVGFFTDYSNLKGSCTFSSGCLDNVDKEFNGGAVEVKGLEASFKTQWTLTPDLSVPLNVNYTYTKSEFQSDFQSSFVQWGDVSKGDSLPYMPENQWSIETGLQGDAWKVAIIAKHVDTMQEAAGQRTELTGFFTDAINQVDVSGWIQLSKPLRVYAKVDNLTDQQNIVSRRPFGARTSKSRQLTVGLKYDF